VLFKVGSLTWYLITLGNEVNHRLLLLLLVGVNNSGEVFDTLLKSGNLRNYLNRAL